VSLEELDDPFLDPAAARPQVHACLLIQLIRIHLDRAGTNFNVKTSIQSSGTASFLPPSYIMTMRHTATSIVSA
jgi:hypothetical protein